MTNLIRSGRPGSAWLSDDLASYNIQISNVDEQSFFEFDGDDDDDVLEPPESLTGFLTHVTLADAEAAGDTETTKLLFIMAGAQSGSMGFVNEFASRMLKNLGYENEVRMVLINRSLLFESGELLQEFQSDVCVMDQINVMLVVREDKWTSEGVLLGNEPQLIVDAIGAFTENQGLSTGNLTSLVIPGILMVGATPVFYKIPITEGLCSAIRANAYPARQTSVGRYLPVPPDCGIKSSMSELSVRRKVVRCYQAFCKFLATAKDAHS